MAHSCSRQISSGAEWEDSPWASGDHEVSMGKKHCEARPHSYRCTDDTEGQAWASYLRRSQENLRLTENKCLLEVTQPFRRGTRVVWLQPQAEGTENAGFQLPPHQQATQRARTAALTSTSREGHLEVLPGHRSWLSKGFRVSRDRAPPHRGWAQTWWRRVLRCPARGARAEVKSLVTREPGSAGATRVNVLIFHDCDSVSHFHVPSRAIGAKRYLPAALRLFYSPPRSSCTRLSSGFFSLLVPSRWGGGGGIRTEGQERRKT
ncbi:uncharacterized protein LOC102474302 [Tupaia chinensis]|uniref:uncharacterized protein LOC102474302 n=1 Tax=Tupaia chinensis TaxID=246437 RepID=UPI0003C8CC24|nr:uncharacterized protein LOC102474302 [Tupaia chinensis]